MGESADRVIITDVTLREYGQNVPSQFLHVFSPPIRIEIAQRLIRLGFKGIEVFSCVHPRVAPAMSKEAIKRSPRPSAGSRPATSSLSFPTKPATRTFLPTVLVLTVTTTPWASSSLLWKPTTFSTWEGPSRRHLKSIKRVAKDAASRGVRLVAYISAAFGFREPETGDLLRAEAKDIAGYLDLLFDLGASS